MSRDLIIAANQQLTQEWWRKRRNDFEIYISQLVLEEIQGGDPVAATERLVQGGPVPHKASADALHIAIATTHGVEYLLTWNCKHLANAVLRKQVERLCRVTGYEPPTICTPQELLEREE